MKYAVVLENVVLCVSEWDGVAPWTPPFGGAAIRLADGEPCEAGYSYSPTSEPRFIAASSE